jgi:hypothetical protein
LLLVVFSNGFDFGFDLLDTLLRDGLVRVVEPFLEVLFGQRELAVAEVVIGWETAD